MLFGPARPGHWAGREEARRAGAVRASLAAKAKWAAQVVPVYAEVLPIIRAAREAGESLEGIARVLNARGMVTVRGLPWNRVQVGRLLNAVAE